MMLAVGLVRLCILIAVDIFCLAITYLNGYVYRSSDDDFTDIFKTAWITAVTIVGIAVTLCLIEGGVI